jgi:GT2 family glycosyltransferase
MAYESSRVRGMAPSTTANTRGLLWGGNFSVSRGTWRAVGGFDESFRTYGGEDTDFGLRVAALGVPLVFEPRALSHHLHEVGYVAYARNAFSEGRSTVRLARKHGLPLDALPGTSIGRPADRLISRIWRWSPSVATRLGTLTMGALWLADRVRIQPLQLAMARLVRRFYRIGGITGAPATEPYSQA